VSEAFDVVVVGGGHNSLVAAAYLARAGRQVCVLEQDDVPGGCVRTEELTVPGYRHDAMSCWHPLFHLSAAWAELGDELRDHGLRYRNTETWTSATAADDGHVVRAHRDPEVMAEAFAPADRDAYLGQIGAFGAQAETVGELLATELGSVRAARLTGRLARRLGVRDGLAFASDVVASSRAWLDAHFTGRDVPDLYAPWVLHTGLDPDGAGGGFVTLAIAGAAHAVGMPVVEGGSAGWVRAMCALIEAHGGEVRTGVDVERVLVREGRAAGVVANGTELGARQAVIAGVTPTQLYGRLLADGAAPAGAVAQAARFRYNRRAGMMLHVALSAPLRWRDDRLAGIPIVHLHGGVDAISLACAQAAAGLLPAAPTVVVGQPHLLDPTRVPTGTGSLWIQLQEVPYRPRGDAAGELDVGDGTWTDDLARAYTERVLARLAVHAPDLHDVRVADRALTPPELERRNPNLVRGDIYSGDASLDQSYVWRPLPGYGSHATPVPGLLQCGASTYPGPGLNAASGRLVAQAVLDGHPGAPVRRALRTITSRVASARR
jgi:phytoene dehydrogenase-like protein